MSIHKIHQFSILSITLTNFDPPKQKLDNLTDTIIATLYWVIVNFARHKPSINQFRPVQQSRQQFLRVYCPNVYNVSQGAFWKIWTCHWCFHSKTIQIIRLCHISRIQNCPVSIWQRSFDQRLKITISAFIFNQIFNFRPLYCALIKKKNYLLPKLYNKQIFDFQGHFVNQNQWNPSEKYFCFWIQIWENNFY